MQLGNDIKRISFIQEINQIQNGRTSNCIVVNISPQVFLSNPEVKIIPYISLAPQSRRITFK